MVLLVLLGVPRMTAARERLAVIVVVDGSDALADNLTEVAIAILAERRDRELVGLREIRDSLVGVLPADGLTGCIGRPDCLTRVIGVAGATEAVTADIRREADRFVIRLALIDTRVPDNKAIFSTTVPQDETSLISAVRKGVADLLGQRDTNARTASARATLSVRQSPVGPPAGAQAPVLLNVEPQERAQSIRGRVHAGWEPYVGSSTAALAVLSLSAAVVAGSLSTATPIGASRAEAQTDLNRRDDYATAANSLLVVGGVLTAAAATSFVLWAH